MNDYFLRTCDKITEDEFRNIIKGDCFPPIVKHVEKNIHIALGRTCAGRFLAILFRKREQEIEVMSVKPMNPKERLYYQNPSQKFPSQEKLRTNELVDKFLNIDLSTNLDGLKDVTNTFANAKYDQRKEMGSISSVFPKKEIVELEELAHKQSWEDVNDMIRTWVAERLDQERKSLPDTKSSQRSAQRTEEETKTRVGNEKHKFKTKEHDGTLLAMKAILVIFLLGMLLVFLLYLIQQIGWFGERHTPGPAAGGMLTPFAIQTNYYTPMPTLSEITSAKKNNSNPSVEDNSFNKTSCTTQISKKYVFPIQPPELAKYAKTHHDYPATDIFAPPRTAVVAVTDGIIEEVNRKDLWDPKEDNPATRGGLFISLIGSDGVRYYYSHLNEISYDLTQGDCVCAGQILGYIGDSGNARGLPHLHFGISHPTFPGDWAVRRGEINPFEYLEDWKRNQYITPTITQKRD